LFFCTLRALFVLLIFFWMFPDSIFSSAAHQLNTRHMASAGPSPPSSNPPSPSDAGLLGLLGQLWADCLTFCASLEMGSAGVDGISAGRDRTRRGACRRGGTCRLLSGWCSCCGFKTVWVAISMYRDVHQPVT